MELDRARIAIRERAWSEVLDLALHVMRRHIGAIAICSLVGILPLAAINHVLIDRLLDPYSDDITTRPVYSLMILIMIESPLATALVTLYLGQALFVDRPSARTVARELFGSLPQLLVLQVVMRAVLIVPLITWILPYGFWPYLNEVILLERNPFTSRGGRMSTLKRNSLLHRGSSGDFIARAIMTGFVALLLTVALYWSQKSLLENLIGFEPGHEADTIMAQIAMWLVVVYFAVARFLGYLDQRIRTEGWEVELLLRAQRQHLLRRAA